MEKVIYKSEATGMEISRAQYIRELFANDMGRKEIAETLGLEYHTVYSATNNLYNAVHTADGSNVISSVPVLRVNADLEFIDAEGNVCDEADAATIMRVDLVKELFEAGLSRKTIAEYCDVKYATVYSATKGMTNSTSRTTKRVIVHPETGEEINRVDYIRELFAAGMTKKEIATKLTILTGELVDYAVVWAATKPAKEEVEEVIETLEDAETEIEETEEV